MKEPACRSEKVHTQIDSSTALDHFCESSILHVPEDPMDVNFTERSSAKREEEEEVSGRKGVTYRVGMTILS